MCIMIFDKNIHFPAWITYQCHVVNLYLHPSSKFKNLQHDIKNDIIWYIVWKRDRHFQVPPVPVLWVWRCRAIVCLVTLWILHLEWSPTEKVCQLLRKVKYIIKETSRTVYLNFVLQSLDQRVPVFARVAEYSREIFALCHRFDVDTVTFWISHFYHFIEH